MNVLTKMLIFDVVAILIFVVFYSWASKRKRLWKILNIDFVAGLKESILSLIKKRMRYYLES